MRSAFGALVLGGITPAYAVMQEAREDKWLQQARAIGSAFLAYTIDNAQAYPDGKTSTEVLQKLIDGGYLTDASVFVLPIPGKVAAASGQKLKAENVCFDVTGGIDMSTPDTVPLLFATGYKITYAASGTAVPVAKPPPLPGLVMVYKGNNAKFLRPVNVVEGTIANVFPAGFSGGEKYRQLTP